LGHFRAALIVALTIPLSLLFTFSMMVLIGESANLISLGSIDFRHDEWGVDVTIGCSQKGLLLPPGLGFNAISEKALSASKSARFPKSYWDWAPILSQNANGFFPYTPATNLLYGLKESLQMLAEEGLGNVFARHRRHGEATRRAAEAWGLETVAVDPKEYSHSVTALYTPSGHSADAFRKAVLDHFNMAILGISTTSCWRAP